MVQEKEVESKRDRFVRVVEKRVNNILQNLDSLGNCSNTRNYEYSQDDVRKIFQEVDKKLRETKLKFDDTTSGKQKFRLKP
jgi:hypothetical protein